MLARVYLIEFQHTKRIKLRKNMLPPHIILLVYLYFLPQIENYIDVFFAKKIVEIPARTS